jgi:hypothetical protein
MNQISRLIAATAATAATAAIAALAVVAGCQRGGGNSATPVSEAYRADIARLCDVVAQAGADKLPAGERALAIASWLPGHLETSEAHDYLIKIQPLAGEPKAAALDAEARRVGLAGCALSAEWRTGAPPASATH